MKINEFYILSEMSIEKCMAFYPWRADGRVPAAGEILIARAIPGILPEMNIDESLDVTRIYSVASNSWQVHR